MPQSYKDLEVYKLAHQLAVRVHRMTIEQLPKFECYETGSQIRRSAKSVAANIVEGFGRKHYPSEYLKHMTYSLASCDETNEHLELLRETNSLQDQALFAELFGAYETLGRKIYRFREAINKAMDH